MWLRCWDRWLVRLRCLMGMPCYRLWRMRMSGGCGLRRRPGCYSRMRVALSTHTRTRLVSWLRRPGCRSRGFAPLSARRMWTRLPPLLGWFRFLRRGRNVEVDGARVETCRCDLTEVVAAVWPFSGVRVMVTGLGRRVGGQWDRRCGGCEKRGRRGIMAGPRRPPSRCGRLTGVDAHGGGSSGGGSCGELKPRRRSMLVRPLVESTVLL